ncbi:MAG: UvrD-helicase domain-containing protein, partial [Desulfobacterales bacterium]|nr:UvrD-helicase domain-containing protein [Desulfobacterales bacterium]
MRTFDLLDTPLEGVNLIEASAGTGKTYTIEGLWLRMILERQLPVEQVLVVTFTKAAVEELKLRIRRKLQSALKACRGEAVADGFVQTLVKRQAPGALEIQALRHALIDFDRAAIFTIHGFCQRLLFENAFETGSLFDTELVSDPGAFSQQIADDFWRHHFYDAPPELIAFALSRGIIGPEAFAELVQWSQVPALRVIPDPGRPSLESLTPYRESLDRLRASWATSRADAIAFLNDPGLSGTVYGSLKPGRSGGNSSPRGLKIGGLVEGMDRFLDPRRSGFPLFAGFEKITAAKIDRARRRGHVRPLPPVFALCQEAFERAQALEAESERFLVYLKASALRFARSALKQLKLQRNVQFFDDLLLRVKRALDSPSGTALADAVRRRYQVALVDEFQDTDPVQYEIFSRLFGTPPSLLFMIGDPKQAIYSFRGADIFAYLKAARDADLKYTLRDNWRSSPGLIRAVNTLFSNTPKPFLFDEITFEHGRAGAPHAEADDRWHPPLTLWFLPSEGQRPMGKTEAVQRISRAVAEEIGRLLVAPAAATGAGVQAGEIAVLVRTNRQANLIKRCLTDLRLPAVLHSAGCVFDSPEALEVERVLASLVDPGDERRFRTALTTSLLGARADVLDGEAEESMFLETRREAFRTYSQVWHRRGFIRMFRLMMAREDVRPRLLSLPEGERRLTNVLQLEELLQRESIEAKLKPSGLLKRLAELRQRSESRLEEHQLRLESDAEAVKIVTIHKSKGLEYPVVFVPFGWEG